MTDIDAIPQDWANDARSRDELLARWQKIQTFAKQYAAEELELRNTLFPAAFPDLTKGQRTMELAGGWRLEGKAGFNYTLDNKFGSTAERLDEIIALGPESAAIAERLVAWKPEIRPGEYDRAPDNVRRIIDKVLTIKPAQVTLKLIPPVTP